MSRDKNAEKRPPVIIDLPDLPDPDLSTHTRMVSPSPPIREGDRRHPTNVTIDPTPPAPASGSGAAGTPQTDAQTSGTDTGGTAEGGSSRTS